MSRITLNLRREAHSDSVILSQLNVNLSVAQVSHFQARKLPTRVERPNPSDSERWISRGDDIRCDEVSKIRPSATYHSVGASLPLHRTDSAVSMGSPNSSSDAIELSDLESSRESSLGTRLNEQQIRALRNLRATPVK